VIPHSVRLLNQGQISCHFNCDAVATAAKHAEYSVMM